MGKKDEFTGFKMKTCPFCKGTGKGKDGKRCPPCAGTGKIPDLKKKKL